MISVASLLNPAASGLRSTPLSPASPSSHPPPAFAFDNYLPTELYSEKHKMVKDAAVFTKGSVKGEVNFPPFEVLDEKSVREMKKYHVHPLKQIAGYPRHIPYNSDKKTFLDKTGRESFEVFQYEFRLPGDEKTYTVMWDYNIGLVRITPFFKCCKYSKTTPAKMLSMNPGLREICHSITGGALAAQGYWMPYSCALAVCATFCAHISGALIPIFGPTFPSRCIATTDASYGVMTIESCIIAAAKAQADAFHEVYSSVTHNFETVKGEDASPGLLQDVQNLDLNTTIQSDRRSRLKRDLTASSIYSTDADASDASISSHKGDCRRYTCSPITPTSSNTSSYWVDESTCPPQRCIKRTGRRTALPSHPNKSLQRHEFSLRNGRPSNEANPILSAIPRSIISRVTPNTPPAMCPGIAPQYWGWKSHNRPLVMPADTDIGYDGEESASGSERSVLSEIGEWEKKAARLLMQLSDHDGRWSISLRNSSDHDGRRADPLGNSGPDTHVDSSGAADPSVGPPATPPTAKTNSKPVSFSTPSIDTTKAHDDSEMDVDQPQNPEAPPQRTIPAEDQSNPPSAASLRAAYQDGPRAKRRRALVE